MSRSIHAHLLRVALFATLALAGASPAAAETFIWPVPFVGVCGGTLQQCINLAAPGDTVLITDSIFPVPEDYTPIDENIVIDKSLTLETVPGIDAVFAPGRTVLVNSPTTGAVSVTLRRLVVRAGGVRVVHRTSGPATYRLDQMRFDGAVDRACAIDFLDVGEGAPSFVVGDSTLRFRESRPSAPSAICADGRGGPWQVSFFRNYIEAEAGSLFAGISIGGTSSGNVTVSGNQLFVYGASRGINVSQNPGSTANVLSIHDNLITGQTSAPPVAENALRVYPTNTDLRIVNNTVVRNGTGISIDFVDGNGSFGRIVNNILAFNAVGLSIDTRFTTIAADQNLGFGNGLDGIAVGTGTVGLDPQFVGMNDFRLRMTSPARDNGNNADVATVLGAAFDADGERRIADGIVDIGAFEWIGDQSVRHVATGTNTIGNNTELDRFQFLGLFENVTLTPLRGPVTGSELVETLGVFQALDGASTYYAFHEDRFADLTPGRRIHAFVPLLGATGFLHRSTLPSVVGAYSRVSHPELDSRPGAIAIVTHNWNPGGGAGTYHDHRLGLDYAAPNWFVGNQDGAVMLSGLAFNIVVAPFGSPNAFVQPVGGALRELRLEHPLLDGNECATPQVGRNGSTFNNIAFSLEYRQGVLGAPGHWYVVNEGAGSPTFPANTAFNVMVSGAQANACRITRLFSDGFE